MSLANAEREPDPGVRAATATLPTPTAGAGSAFDHGLQLVGKHPLLLGIMPCVALTLRLLLSVLVAVGSGALALEQVMFETYGAQPLELGSTEWIAIGIVFSALASSEHVITAALCRVTPRILRGQNVSFDDYFHPRRLVGMLAVRAGLLLIALLGFGLAGVGVVLCLPWLQAPYYFADNDQSLGQAFVRSVEAFKRNWSQVLLFEVAAAALMFGGFLLCGVGLFGAYVVVTASRAALYEIARKRSAG